MSNLPMSVNSGRLCMNVGISVGLLKIWLIYSLYMNIYRFWGWTNATPIWALGSGNTNAVCQILLFWGQSTNTSCYIHVWFTCLLKRSANDTSLWQHCFTAWRVITTRSLQCRHIENASARENKFIRLMNLSCQWNFGKLLQTIWRSRIYNKHNNETLLFLSSRSP